MGVSIVDPLSLQSTNLKPFMRRHSQILVLVHSSTRRNQVRLTSGVGSVVYCFGMCLPLSESRVVRSAASLANPLKLRGIACDARCATRAG